VDRVVLLIIQTRKTTIVWLLLIHSEIWLLKRTESRMKLQEIPIRGKSNQDLDLFDIFLQ